VATSTKLPAAVLYATSARIGGVGLDAVALETLRGVQDRLGLAIAYGLRTTEVPRKHIRSLAGHPVRLLSNLPSPYYYGAKKITVDRVASRLLASNRFDLFHGWSGEALRSLEIARERGIPSVLEIPTWHLHKGNVVPEKTAKELAMEQAPWPQRLLNQLLISRQQSLVEYETADLLLVLSEKAAETFRFAGFPDRKLFRMSRGVDPSRFQPGSPPSHFRALFVGALIKRKGVHTLLEAWKNLALPNAELWLAGYPHAEIEPFLRNVPDNVRVLGFCREIENVYRQSTIHVFPSQCEGSAKSTYEAASCGLAQVTTRESGDVVLDGENGLLVRPNDVASLAAAIETLYRDRELARAYGEAGRARVLKNFTWDHFRVRLLEAYRTAMQLRRPELTRS
jgi:glycosyltransferase involved in cell wall biosynthesis